MELFRSVTVSRQQSQSGREASGRRNIPSKTERQDADMTWWDGTGVCVWGGDTADTPLAHRSVNLTGTFPSSPPESFRCFKSEQKFAAAEIIRRQQQRNKKLFYWSDVFLFFVFFPAASLVHGHGRRDEKESRTPQD